TRPASANRRASRPRDWPRSDLPVQDRQRKDRRGEGRKRTSRSFGLPLSWPGLSRPSCSMAVTADRCLVRSAKPPTSLYLIPRARQRIDDCDLLHREVRHDLDIVLVHDQHFLDAHAIAVALAVLGLKREGHSLLDLDRVIERPDA